MTFATYTDSLSSTQREKSRADQAQNNAGGFVFALDDWKRLDRFLVLGSDEPTYYASARELTRESAAVVDRCIAADGPRTVAQIAAVSDAGRAPKNDPAIFALALCIKRGDEATRRAASLAIPTVCRTGTHLFHFAEAVRKVGTAPGFGPVVRRGLAAWYTGRAPGSLARQIVKYRQRDGWTHRDVLRLARPKATGLTNDVLHYAAKGWPSIGADPHPEKALAPIWAYERAKVADETEIVRLVRDYALPRECVPSEHLSSAAVWDALLRSGDGMPPGAMVRNLGKMTAVGLLSPMSEASAFVVKALTDEAKIRESRLHPMAFLLALGVYAQGHGDKGSLAWTPDASVLGALEVGFARAFGNVVPSGKRTMLALDVSGSMGTAFNGSRLTVREASTAMAAVTLASEPSVMTVAFTAVGGSFYSQGSRLTLLPFHARTSLGDIVRMTSGLAFGNTDCALPMIVAAKEKWPIDTFIIYTDNETWAGNVQPFEALRRYRQAMGIPAKLIVVGMTSTGFTIADPTDAGMLDVVGFDAAAPAVIADFAR